MMALSLLLQRPKTHQSACLLDYVFLGEMMVNHGLLECPIFRQTQFGKMNAAAQATSAPAIVLKDGYDGFSIYSGYGHGTSIETLLEDLLELGGSIN
jgi:hypothetical protein